MVAAQQEEGGSRGRDSVLSCTRKSTGIGLDQFRRLGSLESSGALEKKKKKYREKRVRERERESERIQESLRRLGQLPATCGMAITTHDKMWPFFH